MKLFTATRQTQGQRDNDFCWAEEDELVRFPFECDGERVDGQCGCRRSMAGLLSQKATTTFKVVELPIGKEALQFVTRLPDEELDQLLYAASRFQIGAVCERRGNLIQERKIR